MEFLTGNIVAIAGSAITLGIIGYAFGGKNVVGGIAVLAGLGYLVVNFMI